MNTLKLTLLEVMTVPKRKVVVAVVAITPPSLRIRTGITFRDPRGGRWRLEELALTDVPPPPGQEMVALSPVGEQGSLEQGMELEQE